MNDRAVELLRKLVEPTREPQDCSGNEICTHCWGSFRFSAYAIKHDDDCPYVEAKAFLAEIDSHVHLDPVTAETINRWGELADDTAEHPILLGMASTF